MSPEPDEANRASRKLGTYLESLRADQPRPDAGLVPGVVRKARWQRAVRAPLRAVGTLVGALADGLVVILGAGERRHR